jgi:hypothetical protein
MAIKGKGRTRTRQPIRAPRRAPVPVPVPFARRKGVQLTAAFVAGLLVFWGGIWLTNGLREERATEQESAAALRRRQAGAAWNGLVTNQVGTIGTVQEGSPPVILPEVRATLGDLEKHDPKDAATDLRAAADEAKNVSDAISKFDLTGTIRDKGFDQIGVLRFISARDELVTAIDLLREAALLGAAAADLEGDARAEILERADDLLTISDAAVTRYYQDHTEAMAAAGIIQQPTFPGS